jgi:hypothetical protein
MCRAVHRHPSVAASWSVRDRDSDGPDNPAARAVRRPAPVWPLLASPETRMPQVPRSSHLGRGGLPRRLGGGGDFDSEAGETRRWRRLRSGGDSEAEENRRRRRLGGGGESEAEETRRRRRLRGGGDSEAEETRSRRRLGGGGDSEAEETRRRRRRKQGRLGSGGDSAEEETRRRRRLGSGDSEADSGGGDSEAEETRQRSFGGGNPNSSCMFSPIHSANSVGSQLQPLGWGSPIWQSQWGRRILCKIVFAGF